MLINICPVLDWAFKNLELIIMIKYLVFFLLLYSIFSCKEATYLKSNVYAQDSVSLKTTSIRIEIDSSLLPSYDVFYVYSDPKKEYFYGYNRYYHTLDIFDLDELKFDFHIQLERQGPNGIGDVEGFFILSKDSIFIFSRHFLAVMNHEGYFLTKIQLTKIGDYKQFGELGVNPHFKAEYIQKMGKFLLYSFYPEKMRLSGPIITSLDFNSRKLYQLPIYNSVYHDDVEGELGFITYLNKFYVNDELLVYNFQYESNVYTYNLLTGEKKSYGGKSRFSPGLVTPVNKKNPDHWERHAVENPHYFHILFDPLKKMYYRFHWGMVNYSDNGRFNSFIDKPLYLMIFNEKFEIIGEIKLPDYKYKLHSWTITNNGILISKAHPMSKDLNENFLEFDLLNITLHESSL